MDKDDVSQTSGEWKAFEGIHDQVIGLAGLPHVSSSLCPCFGAPAPKA